MGKAVAPKQQTAAVAVRKLRSCIERRLKNLESTIFLAYNCQISGRVKEKSYVSSDPF